jgi:hypothetical protein
MAMTLDRLASRHRPVRWHRPKIASIFVGFDLAMNFPSG